MTGVDSWTSNSNPVETWRNCRAAIQYINLFLANVDKVNWNSDELPCLDYLHLPLDPCPPLEVAHPLDFHLHHFEPDPRLELVEMLVWKMMVDLFLVWALRIPLDTQPQWTCSLARRTEPLHHLCTAVGSSAALRMWHTPCG